MKYTVPSRSGAIKERARARGRSVEALLCELLEQNFGPEQPGFGDQLSAIWRNADLESIRLKRDRSPLQAPGSRVIIRDTNAISEVMRNEPEPRVMRLRNRKPAEILFASAVILAELRAGISFAESRVFCAICHPLRKMF